MPHFDKYKLLFIHVPKNAGTSLEEWLKIDKKFWHKNVDGFELDHLTAKEYVKRFPKEFRDYFKFGIVRNPYDRVVSEFLHKKRYRDRRFIDATDLNFEEFVREIERKYTKLSTYAHQEVSHFLAQHEYLYSDDDRLLVDYVGRFEDIDSINSYLRCV